MKIKKLILYYGCILSVVGTEVTYTQPWYKSSYEKVAKYFKRVSDDIKIIALDQKSRNQFGIDLLINGGYLGAGWFGAEYLMNKAGYSSRRLQTKDYVFVAGLGIVLCVGEALETMNAAKDESWFLDNIVRRAIKNKNYRLLRVWLESNEAKASPDIQFIDALYSAISEQDKRAVDLIEQYRVNIYNKNTFGCTPLHFAAYGGSFEVVKLLLEDGANPNVVDHYGRSPLYFAACDGSFDVVKLLLENGANPNSVDVGGDTPLYRAVLIEDFDVVKLLLENGTNPDVVDYYGKSPLYAAVQNDNLELVQLLLENGATIHSERGRDGEWVRKPLPIEELDVNNPIRQAVKVDARMAM